MLGQTNSLPLRFVGNSELPPIISMHNGKAAGLAVDLAHAIADKAHLSIRVDATNWPAAQSQVLAGKADALLQVNPTPERLEWYDFSDSLLESHFHLFRKSTRTDIQDLPSLHGRRVGVEAAGFPIQYLRTFDRITMVVIPDWKTGFDMLRADQLDAVFVDRWVGEYVLSTSRIGGIVVVEPPVVSDFSRIAVKKGNRDLLARINAGLQAIGADGTRQRILAKWQAKEVIYLTRESIHRLELYAAIVFLMLLVIAALRMFAQTRATREVNRQLMAQTAALNREIEERKRVEADLRQVNDTLERRVADRTSELQEQVARLRQSEEKFAFAFADNSAAIAITRLEDGLFLEVNDTWLALNGYTREEVIGRSARTMRIWPTQDAATRFAQKLAQTGSIRGWEEEFYNKAGGRFVAQLSATVLTVHGQQVILSTMVDITGRKQAEKALQDSQRLLQDVMDSSISPIFLKDLEGRFITVNAALEKMLGMSREEVKGKTDYDIAIREVADAWRARDQEVLASGEPIQVEESADLKDGHHVFLAVKFPLLDADGRTYGVGAISHDITERKRAEEAIHKRAEEALRMSEHEFHSLAEAMPQIVWATRPDGWNIYFNHQWVDYTGMTMEESYGHGWNTPFHPDDKQRAWDAWQRATQHDEPYSVECRLRGADGAYRWWLIRGAPMRGENGEIVKWFGTCTDIEEIKRAEAALREANDRLEQRVAERTAALRESEAMLRAITENSADPIFLKDRHCRMLLANPATLAAVQKRAEEVIGKTDEEFYDDPAVGRLMMANDRRVMESGQPEMMEEVVPSPGGSRTFLTAKTPYCDTKGRVVGVIGVSRDITERKRAEDALRRTAEELERSNKDLEQFAYVASHDLQEPLRMVSSFMGLLKARYQGQLDAKAQEYIGYAVEGATRMSAMVRDLLDYSRVRTQAIQSVPVDLEDAVKNAVANLHTAITESGARITIDPLPTVAADATHMQQLFQNLIGNAIKFRVKDRRPEVHAAARKEAGAWLFQVSDNGIGIPREYQNQLFGVFQRLHTREEYTGTGIGLATCKSIVERHGGRIWVESKPGEGSTFCFTLPVSRLESHA